MARTTSEQQSSEVQAEASNPDMIEWTGSATTGPTAAPFEAREITRADMKRTYGVDLPEGTGALRWNATNRHRIPVSDLSPDVVRVLLENESGFRRTDKP